MAILLPTSNYFFLCFSYLLVLLHTSSQWAPWSLARDPWVQTLERKEICIHQRQHIEIVFPSLQILYTYGDEGLHYWHQCYFNSYEKFIMSTWSGVVTTPVCSFPGFEAKGSSMMPNLMSSFIWLRQTPNWLDMKGAQQEGNLDGPYRERLSKNYAPIMYDEPIESNYHTDRSCLKLCVGKTGKERIPYLHRPLKALMSAGLEPLTKLKGRDWWWPHGETGVPTEEGVVGPLYEVM